MGRVGILFILMVSMLVAQAPGSTFRVDGPLAGLASDARASRVGDLITIIVFERSQASARAATATSRTSTARAGISSVFGPINTTRLTDLANLSGNKTLDGSGETSRETSVATTLAALVTEVLPNGDLRVAASRSVRANGEVQSISLTGIVRSLDLGPANQVRSDRIAQLNVSIDGRGVVNDAVRRPNFLYRLLLGILPF